MQNMTPTEREAVALIERRLGVAVRVIERFPSGLANYVYDVQLVDGQRLVARLAGDAAGDSTRAAVYWNRLLRPRGVPLPRLLAYELRPAQGTPYLLLERLPGQELGEVYPALTRAQKRALAERIVTIQRAVGQLPDGPGYGFARSYRDPDLLPGWLDVLRAQLARAREWIAGAGVVSVEYVARVEARLPAWAAYCATIAPRPFLDDTTTKNVLIEAGQLSGIVDVDCLCFGDPLFTVGLTRMALLSRAWDTDYIDEWTRLLRLDVRQRHALDLYTAIFCVTFLGELGQAFNRDASAPVDSARVARLLGVLETLLERI